MSEEARKDENYQKLHQQVIVGFPSSRDQLEISLRPYFHLRNSLSVEQDLVLFDNRIIVPHKARRKTLEELHSSHQGMEKTKRRAR